MGAFLTLNHKIMRKVTFYRNVPFIDNPKPKLFWLQKYNRIMWIELPFIGIEIRLK
jgi:hypothetical protein